MKKLMVGLLACLALAALRASESDWMTDLSKAQAKAKAEKKLVLMDFTGSDWCPPCMKLKSEVFATTEFADYAKKNLVLVELDFPRKKQQSAEQKQANQALASKYKVEAYPTIIVLNAEGKKIDELVGYQPGGPKPFLERLEKLKGK